MMYLDRLAQCAPSFYGGRCVPHSISLSIDVQHPNGTAETTVVAGEFSDAELETLHAFYRYVEELTQVKLLRDGFSAQLSVHFGKTGPITCDAHLPPADDISLALYKMRPLILSSEHASYERVAGILGKRFDHPHFRAFLRQIRGLYDSREMQGLFQASAQGVVLNSEAVFQKYLNAFEYHRDQSKKAEFSALHDVMPVEATRGFFVMLLCDKAKALVSVARIVEVILKKTGALKARLRAH